MAEDVKLFLQMKGNTSQAMLDDIVKEFQAIAKGAGRSIEVTTANYSRAIEKDPLGGELSDAEVWRLSPDERAQRHKEFWEVAEGFAFAFNDENEMYKYRWAKVGTILLGITILGVRDIIAGNMTQQAFERISELATKNGCDAHMSTQGLDDVGQKADYEILCRPGSQAREASDPEISPNKLPAISTEHVKPPQTAKPARAGKSSERATKGSKGAGTRSSKSGEVGECPPSATAGKKPRK